MTVREILEDADAVRYGEFTLSSGETSSYYVDVKKATTRPKHLQALADALAERVPDEVDGIACVALGGVPLGVAVSLRTGMDLAIVRKADRDHGVADRVEGSVDGRSLVLIEDVTTTGASAAEAIEALREAGADVATCLVVVDRAEGAADRLADLDVTLTPLVTSDDLLEESR